MAKVVFTYYPFSIKYNHGVALLSAICKMNGIETHIIPMERSHEFLNKISSLAPDYVCVGIVTRYDYMEALQVSRSIKNRGFKIIAGGVFPRSGAVIDPIFDYVCRGEAEEGLIRFLLKNDTSVFEKVEKCDDISRLPMPDYSGVTGYEFDRGMAVLSKKKIIPYSSSRGCPHRCIFCEIRNQPRAVRIKTSVREDLREIDRRFSPEMIQFSDELLPYYRDDWCEQINGNKLPFIANIRADISEEKLRFLIKNGLCICAFGIESGDEKYRNSVLKKDLTDEDIYRTVSILKAFDIEYIPFYMVDTPEETEMEKMKTDEMIAHVGGHWIVFEYEDLRSNRPQDEIIAEDYAKSNFFGILRIG